MDYIFNQGRGQETRPPRIPFWVSPSKADLFLTAQASSCQPTPPFFISLTSFKKIWLIDHSILDMLTLLTLPSEIRNLLWTMIFADQNVTPEEVFNPDRHHCTPCNTSTLKVEWFHEIFKPLLTCKQIWTEAHQILYSTMHVHMSNHSTVQRIIQREPRWLFEKVQTLTMYLHFDEENRWDWSATLTVILRSCPNLRKLILNNHMRPPLSYENLMDAVYFAVPVVLAELSQKVVTPVIQYDYIYEDVMFASPFLGEIRCSDALLEHSAVVKDLIADPEFRRAATAFDFEVMTARLVTVARSYEQPWFQRLQRRRMEELMRRDQATANGGTEQTAPNANQPSA